MCVHVCGCWSTCVCILCLHFKAINSNTSPWRFCVPTPNRLSNISIGKHRNYAWRNNADHDLESENKTIHHWHYNWIYFNRDQVMLNITNWKIGSYAFRPLNCLHCAYGCKSPLLLCTKKKCWLKERHGQKKTLSTPI